MKRNVRELLDQLRRREFHIDCVQMVLTRPSDGKTFSGPGYIRQKSTRDFEIKIYSDGTVRLQDFMAQWGSKKAGVLYDEVDHFSLTAKDETHRTWKAERIVHPGTIGHDG